tara:strand:- start:2497 stop:3183 length:687 start_codon:yes stop_codon:yes gene_type:complete
MIVNRFRNFLRRFDYLLLLLSLLLLVGSPIWEKIFNGGRILADLMTIIILISGLSVTFSHKTNKMDFKLLFGLVTIILSAILLIIDFGDLFSQIVQYLQVFYFLVLTVILIKYIAKSKIVAIDVVINSISGYLLLGLSWAILINMWTNNYSGSFNFNEEQTNQFFNSIYYAFVTLTTLGYGDMLPLTSAAKAFSVLIAITGAFYSTIILGMIVGKFISQESFKHIDKN